MGPKILLKRYFLLHENLYHALGKVGLLGEVTIRRGDVLQRVSRYSIAAFAARAKNRYSLLWRLPSCPPLLHLCKGLYSVSPFLSVSSQVNLLNSLPGRSSSAFLISKLAHVHGVYPGVVSVHSSSPQLNVKLPEGKNYVFIFFKSPLQ